MKNQAIFNTSSLNVNLRECKVQVNGETNNIIGRFQKNGVDAIWIDYYVSTDRNPAMAFQCHSSFGQSTYLNADLVDIWFKADVKAHIQEIVETYDYNLSKWLS